MLKYIFVVLLSFSLFINNAEGAHTIKLKITNPNNASDCRGEWCQVYVEIPAKLYMDKGWLRTDLKNLKFVDGSAGEKKELAYWVIPKKDDNYKVNKLGLWLLVYDLKPKETRYINMVIDDKQNISYCNPGVESEENKSDDRSSYLCAAAVFPFYAYNLNDWKFSKYPSSNSWYDPDTLFINNALYTVYTLDPIKTDDEAKVKEPFTLRIDNMKFYDPSGKYYSEVRIYFLSQAASGEADKLQKKPGYRLYIKKANDFWEVSDKFHYSRRHFVIKLQKRVRGSNRWETQAKVDWYPYNNSRYVFDIKVSKSTISLWINGRHMSFKSINGRVNNGDFVREDSWTEGYFGFDRMGWRLCCGTDINYIMIRNYFNLEPYVEVYGNTDIVVSQGDIEKGKNIIEINPDIQRLSETIGGNTLDKYVFSVFNIARQNQVVKDFSLKIRNRSDESANFHIDVDYSTYGSQKEDWLVYWCDEDGKNCSLNVPSSFEIEGRRSKKFTLKIVPSPSVLFNGGRLSMKVNVSCDEDASFDNAEFIVNVYPKLACYWKYKLPVNIEWQPDHGYDVLYDYQVLAEIESRMLSDANEDGSDIIVTDSFGNQIPFWVKKFNAKDKKLSLWIKVPKIKEGENRVYVWWGNKNFKIPKSDIRKTFDLYESWDSYPLSSVVGCPDGTDQCKNKNYDIDGWLNIPTPDDFYNWWIIKELPEGNKILQADIFRDGKAIDIHNGLCGYSDGSGKSCDTGPYLFNGNINWDHYEVFYKMNAGPYCQYSGCGNPWGNPQYNPVFVMDAGNMWGMEFFADKFIFRPYASGIDYVWQYQTYPKEILGDSFPKKNSWYWVKVRVFKDKISNESYLRVKIAPSEPEDIDKDENLKTVANFTAPPVFSLPSGKIGFGGWDSGFYFDDIRVRKYVEGADGKEPSCSTGSLETLTPREKISLSQPQVSPPFFEGRAAYILTETKPFSWLGDVKALYADCYLGGNCKEGEDQNKLGTISLFGKVGNNVNLPAGLGYYLMRVLPGELNRKEIYDKNWLENGRFILTHINRVSHDFNGFDNFDLSNCLDLKDELGTTGDCDPTDKFYDQTEKLIRFVRGFYVEDFPASKGRNMDSEPPYGDNDGNPEDNEQWKLGSILHSNPLLVGIPNMFYNVPSYYEFVKNHRSRPLVLYFMSNDGMLHAFEIARYETSGLVPRYKPLNPPIELWSYIPEAVLPKLKHNVNSNQSYTADGLLRAIDAQDENGNWRTVLVGGGGRGGNYIFAIDITDPESPKFLWEINKFNHPDIASKLGTAISAPALGKLGDTWVAVFGSGYSDDFIRNYTDKKAYLIIVNLFTGEIMGIKKVSDKIGNVLTNIAVVRDVDGSIKNVVFGDYYGALWNVDAKSLIQDGDLDESSIAFKPCYYDDAFTPEDSDRPITVTPVIAKDLSGKLWVFFGTGDYDEYDPNYPYQRFYGLVLDGKTYTDTCSCPPGSLTCGDFRNMTSSNATNPGKQSWVIELGHKDEKDKTSEGSISEKNNNERVLRKAEVYGGYVFFTTFQPNNSPCGGGKSRFYAVKFNSGELGTELFSGENINQPGKYVTIRSVELSDTGVPSQPIIYTGHAGTAQVVAFGLVNSSTGNLERIKLNPAKFAKNITILLWRKVR